MWPRSHEVQQPGGVPERSGMEAMKPGEAPVREGLVGRLPNAVLALLLRANAELVESGQTGPGSTVLVREGRRCLWVEEAGAPVSAVLVDVHQDVGLLWVVLAYTLPEYRRRGHFATLYEALRAGAPRGRYTQVALGTHVTNAPMQAACEKLGLKPASTQYLQRVK